MTRKPLQQRRRQFVLRPVDSTLLSHVGYFSVGLLVLRFRKSGDVYCYRGCTRSMWLSLCHVRSKGKWFNDRVRGKLSGVKLEGKVKETVEGYITGATKVMQ